MLRRMFSVGSLVILWILCTVPAHAESDLRRSLEVALGFSHSGGESDIDFRGFRGKFRLADRWAIEGSLQTEKVSFVTLTQGSSFLGHADAFLTEFSARRDLKRGRRFELFAFGGPGYFWYDGEPDEISRRDTSAFLHLGLGLDIELTRRLFLRPDIRQRWFEKDQQGDDFQTQAQVSLGWKF